MDDNSNTPGSSKRSDLIIITPDELAKLGLLQEVQTAVKPSILNLKQKLKDKLQTTALEAAKNPPKAAGKLQVKDRKPSAQSKIKKIQIENMHIIKQSKPSVSPLNHFKTHARVNKDIDTQGKNDKNAPVFIKPSTKPLKICNLPGIDQSQVVEDSDCTSSSSFDTGAQHITLKTTSVGGITGSCSEKTKSQNYENETGYVEAVKKEVNVISNTPVCFSNDDLKRVFAKANHKKGKYYPHIQISASDNVNMEITAPKETGITATNIFPVKNDVKDTQRKLLLHMPPKKRTNTVKNDVPEHEIMSLNIKVRSISKLVENTSEENLKQKENPKKRQSNITGIRTEEDVICSKSPSSNEIKESPVKIRKAQGKTYGKKTHKVVIKKENREAIIKHSKIEEDTLIELINVSAGSDNEVVNRNNKIKPITKEVTENVSQLKVKTNQLQEIGSTTSKTKTENENVNTTASISFDKNKDTGNVDQNYSIIDVTEESSGTLLDVSSKTPAIAAQEKVIQNEHSVEKNVSLSKKREQPKKIIDLPKIELDGVIRNDEIKTEEPIISTPIRKKVGRKKKSEIPIAMEEPIVEVELAESRSGRKRKKINYLELENNMSAENVKRTYKRRKISLNNREQSEENNLKNLKLNSLNTCSSSIPTIDDLTGQNNVDTDREESSFREKASEICKSDEYTEHSNNEKSKVEHGTDFEILKEPEAVKMEEIVDSGVDKIGREDEENDNDEKPKDINDSNENINKLLSPRKGKLKGTGETSIMLKSMFSATFRNNSQYKVDTEASNIELIKPPSGEPIDENGTVECVVCKEKVNKEEWESHNRKIHYNLAWREGDLELNLSDQQFVTKTLTPILQEDKNLKCHKCGKIYKRLKSYITHIAACEGMTSSTPDSVTCGVCKEELENSLWHLHKLKQHNNLAWRNGETPLDLNDQSVVLGILNAMYKAKKPLRCGKCGVTKKSVVGFLSHQLQCGETLEEVKVECKLCGKRVLPVSMSTHIKLVHETPKNLIAPKDPDSFDVDPEGSKRKAAQRAMLAIDKMTGEKVVEDEFYVEKTNFTQASFVRALLEQEIAVNSKVKCKFKLCVYEIDNGSELINLLQHMDSCPNKPEEYYTCNKCLSICDTEDEIQKHLKATHGINVMDKDFKLVLLEEDEDEEEERYKGLLRKKILNEKKKSEKDVTYKIKPSFLLGLTKQPGRVFSEAHNYTIEFCEKYFSTEILFNHLRNSIIDWKLLDDELAEKYLPKYGQSCDVAAKKVTKIENVLGHEYSFKKYELFETECDEGIVTIFCGGPINAMAWLPTPYTSFISRQVLAVAAGNDFDNKYLINVHYNESSVIQFWDFGVCINKQKMPEPKLMFCLAFDFGPAWHFEWCPSGCFDTNWDCDEGKMARLGLLAVAGTDSVVYIYSVPALEEDQMGLIYKVKPLLKLCLVNGKEHFLGKNNFYATKISWSMGKGHTYLAVGYSDGMVGLFDIDTKSKFLRYKGEDGVDVILPYKSFQAHSHYISALTLIHLKDGRRWLLTGSFDRNTCVWDLHDGTKYCRKKSIVSDGVWLANWMVYLAASDENSVTNAPIHTVLMAFRGYLYEFVHVTHSRSSVLSLSASSWLNSFIQCNSVGEIMAFFPHQLTYAFDSDKFLREYTYIFGYTKLIDKHSSPKERVAEEKEKQKALQPVTRKNHGSENASHILASKNDHYNKYEPMTYGEACEKYGLTFCDIKMDTFRDLQKSQEQIRIRSDDNLELSKPNLYSMQAINKIAYNPNIQASLYYATGYQMGFVRVTYMKFLEIEPQIV